MADLPVQPVQNYGALLSAYGEGLANQENATTNAFNSRANALQIPSEIAARQAGTGKTQADTVGVGIANQTAAMKLTALQSYLQSLKATDNETASGVVAGGDNERGEGSALTGTSGNALAPGQGATAGGGQSPTDAKADPTFHDDDEASTRMDSTLAAKYQVNKAFTPAEDNRFKAATGLAAVTGDNAVVENAQKAHDQRVNNQVAASQVEAQRHFNSSYTVATAPAGQAFIAMEGIDPKFANHAAAVHGADPSHPEKWTKEQADGIDSDIRKFSTMANEKLFQYTGDTFDNENGSLRNSRTKLPPIGGQSQGLTPQERAQYASEGMKTSDYPDGKGGTYQEHEFKIQGFSNNDAYVRARAQAAQGQSSSAQSTTSDGKVTPPGPGAPGQPGQPALKQHGPQVTNAANTGPIQGRNPSDPAIIRNETDPATRDFLRQASTPQEQGGYGVSTALRGGGAGTKPNPQTQQAMLDQQSARTKLLQDSGQAIGASSQAMQYMNAAKALLDHPESLKTGPMAAIWAKASALGPIAGIDPTQATNYQEVSKYLMNAAIQQGQGNFTRGLTDKDTALQTQTLSPNADMTSPAVRALLDGNIRNTQYAIDSAGRVKKYLAAGGDPLLFADANNAAFNRSKAVNIPQVAPKTDASKVDWTKAPTVSSKADYAKLKAGTPYLWKGAPHIKGNGAQ